MCGVVVFLYSRGREPRPWPPVIRMHTDKSNYEDFRCRSKKAYSSGSENAGIVDA